jgi:hypothetical protein
MRHLIRLLFVLSLGFSIGCAGSGDKIWITGVLHKNGEIYKPPQGHKLALYFCPIAEPSSPTPNGDIEMADYNSQDGTFTVPGVEGLGISPHLYRIAVVETLQRESLDELKKKSKTKRSARAIDRDTNLLEASFGTRTSPFIHELKTSQSLTLDMAKPKD